MLIKLIAFIGFVFIVGCSSSPRPESQKPTATQEMKMPVVTTPPSGLWVTFNVNQELFHAVITNETAINSVLDFVTGKEFPQIPMGTVKREGTFNPPWSWHLDPESIQFVDMATEICDGTPSYLEKNLTDWIDRVKSYCPWRTKIVEVIDCRVNPCNMIFRLP